MLKYFVHLHFTLPNKRTCRHREPAPNLRRSCLEHVFDKLFLRHVRMRFVPRMKCSIIATAKQVRGKFMKRYFNAVTTAQ